MKLTYKTAGLGIAAVAVAILGRVAIAENLDRFGMEEGMDGPGMMAGAVQDLTAADADKDGKISLDELSAHRAARTAAIDSNGDGKLSADELSAMHLQAMTAAAKAMADRMIARLDTDGDALLSAAEMANRNVPQDLFDRVDTNSDGFIDQAEIDAAKAQMKERGGRKGGHGRHSDDEQGEMGDGGN